MFHDNRLIVSSIAALLLLSTVLSGCSKAPGGAAFNDPFEVQNRAVHAANVELDSFLDRPTSRVYGGIPKPVVLDGVEGTSKRVEVCERRRVGMNCGLLRGASIELALRRRHPSGTGG